MKTWADVMKFVRENKFTDNNEDDYATIERGIAEQPVWGDNTRWVAVYAVEGGSEGYYVHIDQLNLPVDRQDGLQRVSGFTSKHWRSDRAIEVVAALTRFVNGWKERAPVQFEAVP